VYARDPQFYRFARVAILGNTASQDENLRGSVVRKGLLRSLSARAIRDAADPRAAHQASRRPTRVPGQRLQHEQILRDAIRGDHKQTGRHQQRGSQHQLRWRNAGWTCGRTWLSVFRDINIRHGMVFFTKSNGKTISLVQHGTHTARNKKTSTHIVQDPNVPPSPSSCETARPGAHNTCPACVSRV